MKKIYFLVCILITGNSFAQIYGTIQGASGNNNVGIGTGVPTANLDIYSTALSGAETLLKLKVSDGLEDYFKIANSTLANSQFIPCLYGYHVTDNRQALYIIGEIGVNNDTGVEAIMTFDSRLSNSVPVNRPLFSWESYGTKKMILNSNGNLGIGTTSPTSKLDVNGTITTTAPGNPVIKFVSTQVISANRNWDILSNANVFGNFDIRYSSSSNVDPAISALTIKGDNGNVGIGTTNPTSKLTVAGNINSREVKVTVDAGADFVFAEDYALPSLDSVDRYIKENKHLPEIAAADEMKKDGINLSEMNIKLLQKVEELTLYMIEQNKKMDLQQKENALQSKQIEEQHIRIMSLQKKMNNIK